MNKAMLKNIIVTGILATVRLADAQQLIFLVRTRRRCEIEGRGRPSVDGIRTATGDAACKRSEGCWYHRHLYEQPAACG